MQAIRPHLRLTVFWLLLALLAGGRGLVPSGWMPVAQGNELTIALCGSGGSVTIPTTDDGESSDADDNAHQTCPYAVAAQTADLPPVPAVVLQPIVVEPDWQAPLSAFALTRAYAPRPPTRGPPRNV